MRRTQASQSATLSLVGAQQGRFRLDEAVGEANWAAPAPTLDYCERGLGRVGIVRRPFTPSGHTPMRLTQVGSLHQRCSRRSPCLPLSTALHPRTREGWAVHAAGEAGEPRGSGGGHRGTPHAPCGGLVQRCGQVRAARCTMLMCASRWLTAVRASAPSAEWTAVFSWGVLQPVRAGGDLRVPAQVAQTARRACVPAQGASTLFSTSSSLHFALDRASPALEVVWGGGGVGACRTTRPS